MTFDPYHKWLGIPPAEQPADHYRLLAIARFESDLDVIEGAADQRMGHLRTFQTGQHSALSQKLLNELSAARLCLLNPAKKAAYDEELRRRVDAAQRPRPAVPTARPLPSAPVQPLAPVRVRSEDPAVIVTDRPAARHTTRRRSPGLGSAAFARLALAAVAIPAAAFVVHLISTKRQAEPKTSPSAGPSERALAGTNTRKPKPPAPDPKPLAPRPPAQPEPSSGGSPAATPPVAPEVASLDSAPSPLTAPLAPAAAASDAKAPPDTTSGLEILEARWGAGKYWADVTAAMQAGVQEGRYLSIVDTPALGQDPAGNVLKKLIVRYRVGGMTRTDTFRDGQVVYLAADEPPAAASSGLTLLEAKYGGGNAWVDVLDRLKLAWSITSDKSKAALSTSADKGPERHDRAAAWWPAPRVRVDCRIARIGDDRTGPS